MEAVAATTMSIAMIAAFVLVGMGVRFVLRPEQRKHGALMIVAGLVILANVLIWTL
ncbi:hypothetical protein [uncultured Sphingomonas sp.]|uniref:hypothetical protein n=1 Tax=uncultured Sphingomonas sp. TaxID=158754 RepID=UPI0025D086A2|nr:hypothetical protein [uncultured Sphingomonas sp.]